jgi:hypothetical protein
VEEEKVERELGEGEAGRKMNIVIALCMCVFMHLSVFFT